MRTGNSEAEYVICPLFREFTKHTIRCESHVPDSNTVEIRYQDSSKCEKQKRLYCQENWTRCEHYLSWKHMKWVEE